jgi:2-keto-4-pentenoate hydratase/2-oxohepta-3-ene-1,7-dioic acid hydratase in catechol pathway
LLASTATISADPASASNVILEIAGGFMKFARRTVDGPDGSETRIIVSRGDGPWLDVRTGLRRLLLDNGVDEAAAKRISTAVVPASMSAALGGGIEFHGAVERVLANEPREAVVGSPSLTNALDPASYRDFMVFEEHFSFAYRWQDKPVPDIMYELPVSYAGDPLSFIGPGDVIPWPSYSQRLDYELELGVVIGRGGIDLTPDEALDHVLGLTILNDVSARDIQVREMTAGLGPSKAKHFACVTGPVITTLDEIPAQGLAMRVRVNGETWCDTTSAEMVWSIAEIVAWASQGEWLHPGALLGTGTCNGGSSIEAGRLLSPGDRVELEVECLGTLANQFGTGHAGGWTPVARERRDDGRCARNRFLR